VFESSGIANSGTPQGRRSLGALAAVALVALLAAGCGSGSGPSETEAREQLEAAATKNTRARSLRASVLFEVEEEGETHELGCLYLAIETDKPERVDLSYYNLNCSGGSEARDLIAIGHRAWANSSDQPERWAAAKIAPQLLHELDDEQTDVKQLFAAAEHITVDPEGGGVEEGNKGKFVDVPKYYFEAPASAFAGADQDLGDVKLEFEATVDRQGFLRELKFHGDEEGTGATVTDEYGEIDQNLGFTAPDPKDVKGPVEELRTRADLDEFFGLPSS
jgi:hypothetical protein